MLIPHAIVYCREREREREREGGRGGGGRETFLPLFLLTLSSNEISK